jgi:hypothetical protein
MLPALGDWGSFLQALAAALAFIWLVYGQYENQKAARENQKSLESQMEITRELVGALTRIASGTQVQAADVLANALPQFSHLSSTGAPLGRGAVAIHPSNGYLAFRNDGDGVTLMSIESRTDGLDVKLERPGACPKGGLFKVWVASRGELRALGTMRVLITFKDKFGRMGWAEITIHSFERPPDVALGMGHSA